MSSSGSSSLPRMSNIDDVLAVTMECGSDITKVAHYLLPALFKLCNSHQGKGQEVLLQAAQGNRDPLTIIDAQQNSLAYVYILATRATDSLEDASAWRDLVPYIDVFVSHFQAEQLHLENPKVHELAVAIAAVAAKKDVDPKWGAETLNGLLYRFTSPIPGQLTTLHALLATYLMRIDQPALAHQWVLSRPLADANRRFSPIKATDVIEYFYAGGCAYLQLGDWDRAESFFEQCITVPAHSAHDRQVLANKKLILAQLLRDGNIKALPSYVSPPVARNLRRFMQPYTAFADTYASKDRGVTQSSLEEVASMHATVFDTDGVVPLISILIQRHPLRRIQRLGNSFTKLSIRDVVLVLALQGQDEAVSDAEQRVLKFVEHLIANGELQATLSPHDPSPILTFQPTSTAILPSSGGATKPFASLESIATLSKQMQLLQQWNVRLEAKEREIARSAKYVQKQQSAINAVGAGRMGGPGGQGGPAGWGGGMMFDGEWCESIDKDARTELVEGKA